MRERCRAGFARMRFFKQHPSGDQPKCMMFPNSKLFLEVLPIVLLFSLVVLFFEFSQ
jgi:hypothetical protein